jgi:hypothetical protein
LSSSKARLGRGAIANLAAEPSLRVVGRREAQLASCVIEGPIEQLVIGHIEMLVQKI